MAENVAWYFLPINPQPWTTPPFSPARVGGKMIVKAGRNEDNHMFKLAVQEELQRQGATMITAPYKKISFVFWRKLDQYEDSAGRKRSKNRADATNMQKLTEDALQGILFENDRDNFSVSSHVAEQTKDTVPGILIVCEWFDHHPDFEIPPQLGIYALADILKAITDEGEKAKTKEPDTVNEWPPRQ